MFRRLHRWFKDLSPDFDTNKFEVFSLLGRMIISVPIVGGLILGACRLVGAGFSALIPTVPVGLDAVSPLSDSGKALNFYLKICYFAYPFAVVACLGMSVFMSWRAGTLSGSDARILYFQQDLWNIALYIFVVPAYVCVSICLIITATMSWAQLNNFIDVEIASRTPNPRHLTASTRVALFLGASFLVSGIFTAEFATQLSNLKGDCFYWFFSRGPLGDVTLNIAGAYYLYMNAVLLFLTAMAALCYIAMSVGVFRLAHEIRVRAETAGIQALISKPGETFSSTEQRIRKQLANFMLCYGLAKVLILIYALNIYIWQRSPMGRVHNTTIAILVLVAIGVIFLGFPRLRLASVWHRIKRNHANATLPFEGFQLDDLKKVQPILDLGFFGLVALIFEYQFGFSSIPDFLQRMWDRLVQL